MKFISTQIRGRRKSTPLRANKIDANRMVEANAFCLLAGELIFFFREFVWR